MLYRQFSVRGTVLASYVFSFEAQVLTLVRAKNIIQASNGTLCPRGELVFLEIPPGTTRVEPNAFKFCSSIKEVDIPDSVDSIQRF